MPLDLNQVPERKGFYRLLALDLDDTLLRDDKTVSGRNLNAVAAARRAGLEVVIASGRHPNGIVGYARELGLVDAGGYAICFNGAALISLGQFRGRPDALSFGTLGAATATGAELALITGLAHRHGCTTHAFDTQRGLVLEDPLGPSSKEYTHSNLPYFTCDLSAVDPGSRYYKILAVGSKAGLDALRADLPGDLTARLSVLRSHENFLEFIPGPETKGSALCRLCGILGVPVDRCIAFGDAENDAEMLRRAGLGVAMANGTADAKGACDALTASNEEDGVALLLERVLGI